MQVDDRISFVTGFIFTTASTISAMGLVQAAAIGLIGGFFGLLGKELYHVVKKKLKCKR
jgi:uncharacterized membrane protein (DUF373 family)